MKLRSSRNRDTIVRHRSDRYLHKGYEYHGNLFKNMMSPELFSNPTMDFFYRPIEKVMEGLIDSVKNIKHHLMFAIDKDEIDKID